MLDEKTLKKAQEAKIISPEKAQEFSQKIKERDLERQIDDAQDLVDAAQSIQEEQLSTQELAALPATPTTGAAPTAGLTQAQFEQAQQQQVEPTEVPEFFPSAQPEPITKIEPLQPGKELSPDDFIQAQAQEQEVAAAEPDGFTRQIDAVEDLSEAQIKEAEAQVEASAEKARETQRQLDLELAQQQQEQARIREADQKLLALKQEVRDSVASKDPGRFRKNLDLGESILAFIGITLGASGGGPNRALELYRKRVEDDIKLQESQIDVIKEEAKGQENLLSELRNRFKDNRAARAANRALVAENFQARLEQISAKFKSPQVKANAEKLIGQLETEKQKHEAELALLTAKASKQSGGFRFGRGLTPANKEEAKRFIPGVGLVGNEKLVKPLADKMDAATSATNTLNELQRIANRPLNKLEPKTRARVNTLRAGLRGQLRLTLIGPGQVSELEQKILDDAIGNINSFLVFPGTQQEKLIVLKEQVNKAVEKAQNNAGLGPSKSIKFVPDK